ncbi:Na+/H+ antiporter subunit E [Vibrio sp. CAU 1672]|uniref:Na+/H+ antiporter subunit E n=1 Tax=Vibrio sp. CAU 1672 TaxID=3032594 RepID=UPI0023DA5DA5|nr:Na+/H+ antiporter subunit E [Vibrio sp. CAU 1672]MDF2153841.1 Na+/H+ antiporter subunit E [Vibrio sp. CAU 1672]
MNYFLLNLFLAFAWMLLNGQYSSMDFATGFLVGLIALKLGQPFGWHSRYFRRFKSAFTLLIYFSYQMLASALRVVWDVVTPQHLSEPDIVYVPLDASSDLEITLLANMISLTPGSLSLDVTPDKKYLSVHVMFAPDHEVVIREIKQGLERKLLEVTRE